MNLQKALWSMDKNIFPFMSGIDFLFIEDLIEDVSREREKITSIDKQLMKTASVSIDIMNAIELPVGKFDTVFQGICMECFAFIKKDAPLYVMLNGANVADAAKDETFFNRWSYYTFCSGSVLCIADPMLKMYDGLLLGWYYGDNQCNLRKVVADFVIRVAEILKVAQSNIVFVGSSGGVLQYLSVRLISVAQRQ